MAGPFYFISSPHARRVSLIYFFVKSVVIFILTLSAYCGIVLMAGCSTPKIGPSRTRLSEDRIALPTSRSNNLLFVEVRINGAGPFRLVVDTGAGCLVLSPRVVKEAKLKLRTNPGWAVAGVYDTVSCGAARVDILQSSGFILQNLDALIGDGFGNLKDDLGPVDGAIGLSAFADVALEMDFAASQVNVLRSGRQKYPMSGARDYHIDESGCLRIEMEVADQKLWVVLDTGATGPLSVPNLDALTLLYPKVKMEVFSMGLGHAFKVEERSQLASDARLGSLVLRHLPIQTGPELRVGAEVLGETKLVVNQRERRIYLSTTKPVLVWEKAIPPAAKVAFGFFYRTDESELYVLEVSKDSPGDLSRLRAGDEILTIDGQPAAARLGSLSGPQKNSAFEPLALQVKHRGKIFQLTLVPENTAPANLDSIIVNCNLLLEHFPDEWDTLVRRASAKAAKNDFAGCAADLQASTKIIKSMLKNK